MVLKTLQSRIKYSNLYTSGSVERLYIRYGINNRDIQTTAWFEVVNDKLKVFVRVRNARRGEYNDIELAERYKADIERQFYEIMEECELERKKIPLHRRLRDQIIPVYDDRSMRHQVDALRFCCSMKVSALYADVGTGKTKIAIDLANSRYDAGQIRKVIVFLPVATKQNFQRQIDLWGNKRDIEWFLVGHESIGSSDRVFLGALLFTDPETMIIIDESHAIKTPTAKRSRRVQVVCDKTSYKIIMTGTPVTDNIYNLYMQYTVLSPFIIGLREWTKFEERYLIMGGYNNSEVIGYKNIDHLMGLVEPYTYQVTKEECLDLPAKKTHTHLCKLNSKQQLFYEKEKKCLLETILHDSFSISDIFQALTRIQQICCGYYSNRRGEQEFIGTEKTGLLEILPASEKIVFFCKFLFEINIITQFYGRERCAVFCGKNAKERDAELEAFVRGEKQYFVATMQSGGTGLNGLQYASRRVVFFSNSFSYFHRKQSIGRIDRQGQRQKMHIHDFRTTAKMDDKIMANLYRKENLANEIKTLMMDKTKLKRYVENL